VIGGVLHAGDTVYLLPGEKKLRVRYIERYGKKVEEVVAGDRAAVNLVGLNREDFKRGMIISDRILHHTSPCHRIRPCKRGPYAGAHQSSERRAKGVGSE